jgi:trk system potassium uptake protein
VLLRPTRDDVRVIGRTVGLGLLVLGSGTTALALLALTLGEFHAGSALATGAAIEIAAGSLLRRHSWTRRPLSWTRGVVAATATWLTCSVTAAVPLYLSGHYGSWLDASFEGLSGLTTSGLTLVQDLDHLATSLMLYRHLLELIGAMAIVIAGLTILTAPTATASSLAPSDARDERILPSLDRTARRVLNVGGAVLVPGLVAVTITVFVAGMDGWRAITHGASLTIAAGTTGGFTASSASVGYYHSGLVQAVLVPLMIAGALSFALYQSAARGDRFASARDIELQTLALSITGVLAIVLIGLGRSGSQVEFGSLFGQGFFTAVSAHTTTGLHVVSPRLIGTDWGQLAPAALVAAMAIGGTTGSPAGGLKVLRVGIILRGVIADVRRVLLPESSLVVSTFHWGGRRRILEHAHVRSAATLLLLLVSASLAMSVLILFVDGSVHLTEALFLAVSAASNSGITLGLLGPDSATAIKVGLMGLMLLGRLEWLAVFSTLGFIHAGLRGRA